MPAGRPTKYKPEMCKTMITLFKQGASIAEVCLELDIHHDTFYEWKERHEEFSESVKKGLAYSKGWWEKQGRLGVWADTSEGASRLNYTGWFMNMKNRFKEDWRDKHETPEEKEQNIPKIQVEVITKKDGEDS